MKDALEFITMLLIENRAMLSGGNDLRNYIDKKCGIETFNKRYNELLDNFLSQYALNKTEKSELNL